MHAFWFVLCGFDFCQLFELHANYWALSVASIQVCLRLTFEKWLQRLQSSTFLWNPPDIKSSYLAGNIAQLLIPTVLFVLFHLPQTPIKFIVFAGRPTISMCLISIFSIDTVGPGRPHTTPTYELQLPLIAYSFVFSTCITKVWFRRLLNSKHWRPNYRSHRNCVSFYLAGIVGIQMKRTLTSLFDFSIVSCAASS